MNPYGWLDRPARGSPPVIENPIEEFLATQRASAEGLGEWAFYAAVILIALALIKYFPYHYFYKTHRLLAVVYLVLVYHAVVLTDFDYWTAPVGVVMALLLAYCTWAAAVVLVRRVGVGRQVRGKIAAIRYYPGVRTLETAIHVPRGWPGHKPGQFAFATSNLTEGAHPYTIASGWNEKTPRITFITKELGDHTSRLRAKLQVGQDLKIEGPYGCFTFDDARVRQIWIGGGIGITPFVAQMKHISIQRAVGQVDVPEKQIDLFYTWRAKYGGMDASLISQMKAIEDENRRLKRMYADLSMQADLLKEALGKNVWSAPLLQGLRG